MCFPFQHRISRSFVSQDSSYIVTHLKSPKLFSVRLGYKKNIVVIKQTTVFLFRLVFLHQIAFQITNTQTKNKAINNGRIQATKVFTTKIELIKNSLLKSARKQSKEMIVSVVCPKT